MTSTIPEVTVTSENIGETITDLQYMKDLPIGAWVLYVGTLRNPPRPYAKVSDTEFKRLDIDDEPNHVDNFLGAVQSERMRRYVLTSTLRVGQHVTVSESDLSRLPIGTRFRNRSGTEWEGVGGFTAWRAQMVVNDQPDESDGRPAGSFTDDRGFTITRLPNANPNVEAATARQELIEAQRARIEQLEREQEEFKHKVGQVAMQFAEDNDLCGEVERCLREVGIEPPSRWWEFTLHQTIRVRAQITTTGSERVPDEDFILRSLQPVDDPIDMDSDWAGVHIDNAYDSISERFTVSGIERAEDPES